jgi:hypothetical protein
MRQRKKLDCRSAENVFRIFAKGSCRTILNALLLRMRSDNESLFFKARKKRKRLASWKKGPACLRPLLLSCRKTIRQKNFSLMPIGERNSGFFLSSKCDSEKGVKPVKSSCGNISIIMTYSIRYDATRDSCVLLL